MHRDDEEELLRSVAIQNAQSILAARQRAEQEMLMAKAMLEQKMHELSRALAAMQATLESMQGGALAVDERRTVTAFSQTYVRMWGLPAAIMESRDHRRIVAFVAPQLRDPQGFLERVEAIVCDYPRGDLGRFGVHRWARLRTLLPHSDDRRPRRRSCVDLSRRH